MVEFPDIPVDILLFNIFLKIPIKSLLKLRSVSKLWCKIIVDPVFAYMQYHCGEIQQETPLIFPESTEGITLYAASDNEEDKMIHAAKKPMAKFEFNGCVYGSCNGLMYFVEYIGFRVVVSNPLRSQFKILPPMNIEHYFSSHYVNKLCGLGFDTSTKTFKMVCTIYTTYANSHTLVHTLGATPWREIPTVPVPYLIYGESVFVHGYLHWMIEPVSEIENCKGVLMAFDVSEETFELIRLPEICLDKNRRLFRVLDIKGNLAMFDLSFNTKIDIWVMDYEKKLWSKDYTINISTPLGENDYGETVVIGNWKQDEILLSSNHGYWIYNMMTGDVKYKHISGFSSSAEVYRHRGSLISISDVFEIS